jgi:hypothetical protein
VTVAGADTQDRRHATYPPPILVTHFGPNRARSARAWTGHSVTPRCIGSLEGDNPSSTVFPNSLMYFWHQCMSLSPSPSDKHVWRRLPGVPQTPRSGAGRPCIDATRRCQGPWLASIPDQPHGVRRAAHRRDRTGRLGQTLPEAHCLVRSGLKPKPNRRGRENGVGVQGGPPGREPVA